METWWWPCPLSHVSQFHGGMQSLKQSFRICAVVRKKTQSMYVGGTWGCSLGYLSLCATRLWKRGGVGRERERGEFMSFLIWFLKKKNPLDWKSVAFRYVFSPSWIWIQISFHFTFFKLEPFMLTCKFMQASKQKNVVFSSPKCWHFFFFFKKTELKQNRGGGPQSYFFS